MRWYRSNFRQKEKSNYYTREGKKSAVEENGMLNRHFPLLKNA